MQFLPVDSGFRYYFCFCHPLKIKKRKEEYFRKSERFPEIILSETLKRRS
ncbi:hypothetical protein LEP1GSC062_1640 [Leptospira alexanderi serovar Manhao 3 str. L 60]|uniref:Uncharacterized protein n=1 Tax=Leptospira alexanderi serovar Manhao 3 str. L 60 TaxID=1049759 RepID=V6HU44_9LEPT|nr:hypothetical protein LEP1GSC062_1640 [Leptospira alexanderi serovar Manhao 3 str. L 60]